MPFGATPSRWCVCQFHHFRSRKQLPACANTRLSLRARSLYQAGMETCCPQALLAPPTADAASSAPPAKCHSSADRREVGESDDVACTTRSGGKSLFARSSASPSAREGDTFYPVASSVLPFVSTSITTARWPQRIWDPGWRRPPAPRRSQLPTSVPSRSPVSRSRHRGCACSRRRACPAHWRLRSG